MNRSLFGTVAVVAVATSLWALEPAKKFDQEAGEQAFAAKMTDVTLVGAFTVDGKDSGSQKPDRYQIVSAKKIQGDDWVVTAKMKIGQSKEFVPIPIPIKIYWAGDTPVMSLTDLTIPGMGTFTSRVMFHGDRYAGTWQHGEVGGHMWGLLEKTPAK